MESETFEDISQIFNQIDIEDEPGSEKNDLHVYTPKIYKYKPKQIFPKPKLEYVNFDLYIKENCENKIKILNRKTFTDIKRPILIFFHHFQEKCAYLTKWLDRIYQLCLKYDKHIDFIAADMYDMDLIYPRKNPITFYCRLVRPEDDSPNIYAIDERKRIYQHFDAYNTLENLTELCENFLSGKLFPSQPLPENNDKNSIKICVHNNYEELVKNSTKNIFLIINLSRYQATDVDYYKVALALRDYNLDIIYMEAEENYVPFEYCANSYPTILYIPCYDKENFIYYYGYRSEENVIEFLTKCLEQPDYVKSLQQEQDSTLNKKNVKVSADFSLAYQDLPEFLKENYENHIMLLDRELLEKSKRYSLLIFMDFFEGKCLAHHVDWLNKIYQVAETCYSFDIFIADFKDIDVISPRWIAEDMVAYAQGKPRIYGFDRLRNIYYFGNFHNPAELFYFTNDLVQGDLFYSELYPRNMENQLVKSWTANYFKIFLKKLKKHIFITFYHSDDHNENMFELLTQIAKDVNDLNVEIVKFDIKFNYLSIEYEQPRYPVHYFLPKNNKKDSRLFVNESLSRDKILEFIKSNIGKK